MPLLYYWRGDNYRRDLDMGAGYHLNQASSSMHQIDIGDSLWAFTRTEDGRYVLAAELVVRAKTLNPSGFRYGRYRIWGDLSRGGDDAKENLVLICPNHHTAIHRCDAPFDYQDLAFDFGDYISLILGNRAPPLEFLN